MANQSPNEAPCAKCKKNYSRAETIRVELSPSTGESVRLCLKHHREWADIENSFIQQARAAVTEWLSKEEENPNG